MSQKKAKFVLLGSATVGKTSIVLRFVRGQFNRYNESTIGAAFLAHKINLSNNDEMALEIWDTAGQERYAAISHMYYRGSDAGVVVYDITSSKSYQRAKKWVKTLRREVQNMVICLCGNKCDLVSERAVKLEEAENYAEEMNILFFEVSAKEDTNISKMFVETCEEVDKVKNRDGDDVFGGRDLDGPGVITLAPELSSKGKCSDCNITS